MPMTQADKVLYNVRQFEVVNLSQSNTIVWMIQEVLAVLS